jgi:hypothetical protein
VITSIAACPTASAREVEGLRANDQAIEAEFREAKVEARVPGELVAKAGEELLGEDVLGE